MGLRLRRSAIVLAIAASTPACSENLADPPPPEPPPRYATTTSSPIDAGAPAHPDAGGAPTTTTSAAIAACSDFCDWEASVATDCPADMSTQCKAACKLVIQPMDATCQDTAARWATCMKQNGDPATVACGDGGSNLASSATPPACEALTSAYGACQHD